MKTEKQREKEMGRRGEEIGTWEKARKRNSHYRPRKRNMFHVPLPLLIFGFLNVNRTHIHGKARNFSQVPQAMKRGELGISNMKEYRGNMKKYIGNMKKYALLYMGRGTEKFPSI